MFISTDEFIQESQQYFVQHFVSFMKTYIHKTRDFTTYKQDHKRLKSGYSGSIKLVDQLPLDAYFITFS